MKIIDNRTSYNRGQWQGLNNTHQYIAIHYLGVDAENPNLYGGGYGGHYTILWNGDIYWSADHNAVLWQVGTAGCYTKKYPNSWDVTNYNCVGIEMCCHCENGHWYFTEATQNACVELVKYLMKELNLPASHVLRHYDIVNKTCPAPYVTDQGYKTNWTWDQFKAKISESVATSGGVYMFNCKQVSVGSTGSSVKLLQRLLKAEGYSVGEIDGIFGAKTDAAVRSYQTKHRLVVDGIVGQATWKTIIGL